LLKKLLLDFRLIIGLIIAPILLPLSLDGVVSGSVFSHPIIFVNSYGIFLVFVLPPHLLIGSGKLRLLGKGGILSYTLLGLLLGWLFMYLLLFNVKDVDPLTFAIAFMGGISMASHVIFFWFIVVWRNPHFGYVATK
tara:strand:+ start:399 stop:809 length:411 start_codon:yes stop_codon:yes gene_type:complete